MLAASGDLQGSTASQLRPGPRVVWPWGEDSGSAGGWAARVLVSPRRPADASGGATRRAWPRAPGGQDRRRLSPSMRANARPGHLLGAKISVSLSARLASAAPGARSVPADPRPTSQAEQPQVCGAPVVHVIHLVDEAASPQPGEPLGVLLAPGVAT